MNMINNWKKKVKQKVASFMKDERGEFSIKTLAIIVGSIVVIGVIVAWLAGGQMEEWITTVWETIWEWIQDFFT